MPVTPSGVIRRNRRQDRDNGAADRSPDAARSSVFRGGPEWRAEHQRYAGLMAAFPLTTYPHHCGPRYDRNTVRGGVLPSRVETAVDSNHVYRCVACWGTRTPRLLT
ncbi:hypothetical protein PT7_P010 (plasmid) [Pusillimonas sp. T7-7]|nr:hypothetical protein PT7_P010 [Pusillimonas sp. T7-7]